MVSPTESPGSGTPLIEFWSGLTRPTWLVAALALVVAAVGSGLVIYGISPAVLDEENYRYLAVGRKDPVLLPSSRVTRLPEELLDRPAFFLLGASGVVELVTNQADLEHLTSEAAGRDVFASDLSFFGQSFLDSALIMDRLPRRFDGVVVVGVSPRLIAMGWESQFEKNNPFGDKIALRSERVEELMRQDGHDVRAQTGSYFWDHRRFFLPRIFSLVWNRLRGPLEVERHAYYEAHGRMPERFIEMQLLRIQNSVTRYEAVFEKSMGLLVELAGDLRERGDVTVVFLETPVADFSIERGFGSEFYAAHLERMQAFANEHEILYWSLKAEAALTDDDFYDYIHLFKLEAQERFSRVLCSHVGELLKERTE